MSKFVYKLSLSLRWVFKLLIYFRTFCFNRRASHIILEYHSVGADVQIELDISVDIFEQHLRYLKTNCDVVSLDHYLKNIEGEQELIKPLVALTFDDGYDNFYTKKFLPLLKKYDLPATLFPALNFIDEPINVPIKSSIGNWNEFRPLSMSELRSVVDSPLINVQSHGYAHLIFPNLRRRS